MSDYLASLDRLEEACAADRIEFILPAHGYVLGNVYGDPRDAADVIRRLRAHRLQREAKILAVMRALPEGTMQEWLEQAYDDVPPRMWPVAMRSLTAHVERLREMI
jgi:recombination protein RecT